MSDARRYAVWPDPRSRSRSRSLKGSRPSVPHGTNFMTLNFICHISDHSNNLSISLCRLAASTSDWIVENILVSSANFNMSLKPGRWCKLRTRLVRVLSPGGLRRWLIPKMIFKHTLNSPCCDTLDHVSMRRCYKSLESRTGVLDTCSCTNHQFR